MCHQYLFLFKPVVIEVFLERYFKVYYLVIKSSKKLILVFHKSDNVAVALENLRKMQEVEAELNGEKIRFFLVDDIPFGHKVAIRNIQAGELVIKYGEVIGVATRDIKIGEHVHVHNVASTRIKGV